MAGRQEGRYMYTCVCVFTLKSTLVFFWGGGGGEGTNRLCTTPVAGGLLAGLKSPSVLGVVPGKSIPSRGSPRSY